MHLASGISSRHGGLGSWHEALDFHASECNKLLDDGLGLRQLLTCLKSGFLMRFVAAGCGFEVAGSSHIKFRGFFPWALPDRGFDVSL